jgi:pimeloyl-ACP methyl ester carboxylesterase
MTTFALIHGSHHGAWCWGYLVPELRRRGHDAVTMDLPAEDTTAGVSTCAQIVIDALAHATGDVVVVGHSGGGLIVPVVASRRPAARMIFIAAVIPRPGVAFAEQRKTDGTPSAGGTKITHEDGTQSRPPDEARRIYYHDCTEEQIRWALPRLRRQSPAPFLERSPLSAWPDVPSDYIVCTKDRSLDPAWERRVARERLGVTPLEIDSGHSPFLSRPAQLADLLVSTLRA